MEAEQVERQLEDAIEAKREPAYPRALSRWQRAAGAGIAGDLQLESQLSHHLLPRIVKAAGPRVCSRCALAQAVGQKTTVKTMERALKEGRSLDERLTQLAEREITPQLLSDESGENKADEGPRQNSERRKTTGLRLASRLRGRTPSAELI